MLRELQQSAEQRMEKCMNALQQELLKIRTGRANTSLLDHVKVDYYGQETPLNQVASVTVSDARTLTVAPWEKAMVGPIEKAILESGLGLNPVSLGQTMKIPMPALTEERRRDLTKIVKVECESARVAVRNIRRDINAQLKEMVKNKSIPEDDERTGQEQIQKLTDRFVKHVDECFVQKEKELLEI